MTKDNDKVLQNPSQKSNFSWSCCFLWTIIGCGIGGIIYLALYITSANNKRNCQNSDTNKAIIVHGSSSVKTYQQDSTNLLDSKRKNLSLVANDAYIPYTDANKDDFTIIQTGNAAQDLGFTHNICLQLTAILCKKIK